VKKIYLLVVMLVFFAGCSAPDDTNKGKVKNEAPAFNMEATKLASDYAENDVVADKKYKDKIVVVKGKIYEIGKDPLGQPFIVIGGREFGFGAVKCVFARGKDSSVAVLSKGKVVSVRGKVSGKIVTVQIEDSSLQ
jgi:hypothetical protein